MDPFIGEIRAFTYNYIPQDWLPCDGQLLPIQQYQALAAVLGTQYGGDGQTTFALPNLQGSTLIGAGAGPGLTPYTVAESVGQASVTLVEAQMYPHEHIPDAKIYGGPPPAPLDSVPAADDYLTTLSYSNGQIGRAYATTTDANPATMALQTVGPWGTGGPHENRQPFAVMWWGIATTGIFPIKPS